MRPPKILIYFDMVSRHGSIRKAASVLRIASSALNRQILNLESEVGVELLERLPKGVRLTAAGELFADYVRRTIADLDAVEAQIESLRGLVRGKVRLAAAESAVGDFLPRAILNFQRSHPGVQFSISVGNPEVIANGLLGDAYDLILTHDTLGQNDITVIGRMRQSFCALVSKDHPLASRKQLFLRECQPYPIALADESLAGRALIERSLSTSSFRLQPALVSNSIEAMKAYVRLSQAICFQYGADSRPGILSGDVIAVPLSDVSLRGAELLLGRRRGRALPTAAAAFAEELSDLFVESAKRETEPA